MHMCLIKTGISLWCIVLLKIINVLLVTVPLPLMFLLWDEDTCQYILCVYYLLTLLLPTFILTLSMLRAKTGPNINIVMFPFVLLVSAQSFERVLVENKLHGLSPALTEAIQSIPRHELLQAALPHVLHCTAILLSNRNKLGNCNTHAHTAILCWIDPEKLIMLSAE